MALPSPRFLAKIRDLGIFGKFVGKSTGFALVAFMVAVLLELAEGYRYCGLHY